MIWSLVAIVKLVFAVLSVPLATLTVVVHQRLADFLQREVAVGELGRIDLDTDRRRAVAEDRDLRDARDLRDLLSQEQVGVVVDRGQRNRCPNAAPAAGSASPPD